MNIPNKIDASDEIDSQVTIRVGGTVLAKQSEHVPYLKDQSLCSCYFFGSKLVLYGKETTFMVFFISFFLYCEGNKYSYTLNI